MINTKYIIKCSKDQGSSAIIFKDKETAERIAEFLNEREDPPCGGFHKVVEVDNET